MGELLKRISSYELTEWMAFERAYGPIGREYQDFVLACIHEQLQFNSWVTGAQFEKNPAPKPLHYPRPDEIFKPAEDEVTVTREHFDSQFKD